MMVRVGARPAGALGRVLCCSWTTPSSRRALSTVRLAYDLHEPPPKPAAASKSADPNRQSPILFLHGLFGSRKNNRSISRQLARDLGRSIYALVGIPSSLSQSVTDSM